MKAMCQRGGSSNDYSQLLFIVDICLGCQRKFIFRVHGASLAKAVPPLFGECSGHHRNVRDGPLIHELTCSKILGFWTSQLSSFHNISIL